MPKYDKSVGMQKREQKKPVLFFKRPIVQKSAIAVFLLLILIGITYLSTPKKILVLKTTSTWSNYLSEDPGFSVLFPTPPTKQTISVVLGNEATLTPFTTLISKTSDAEYRVEYLTFPDTTNLVNTDNILLGSAKWSLNIFYFGSQITTHKFIRIANYPAIEYTVKNEVQKTYSQAKSVLIGKTLYTLTVSSKNKTLANKDKFLASFRPLPQPTKTQ